MNNKLRSVLQRLKGSNDRGEGENPLETVQSEEDSPLQAPAVSDYEKRRLFRCMLDRISKEHLLESPGLGSPDSTKVLMGSSKAASLIRDSAEESVATEDTSEPADSPPRGASSDKTVDSWGNGLGRFVSSTASVLSSVEESSVNLLLKVAEEATSSCTRTEGECRESDRGDMRKQDEPSNLCEGACHKFSQMPCIDETIQRQNKKDDEDSGIFLSEDRHMKKVPVESRSSSRIPQTKSGNNGHDGDETHSAVSGLNLSSDLKKDEVVLENLLAQVEERERSRRMEWSNPLDFEENSEYDNAIPSTKFILENIADAIDTKNKDTKDDSHLDGSVDVSDPPIHSVL